MSILLPITELYKADFELTDLFAMRQVWKKGALFSMNVPRKNNGIIFLDGCIGVYTDCSGEKFTADTKSVVFLPENSKYSVLNDECGISEVDAYLIEFNLSSNGENICISDKPFLVSQKSGIETKILFDEIVKLYESSVRSYPMLKSKIYALIYLLFKDRSGISVTKYGKILKGIEMLESNIYGNVSVSDAAAACNISETHFRRLFKEYAQKSPIRYRIELKIEYAKRLLTDTDMTVDGIAQTLCFESTSYFCRAFKNNTGFTPSEYRNS